MSDPRNTLGNPDYTGPPPPPLQFPDISSSSVAIKAFNAEYENYKKINTAPNSSLQNQVIETTNILNREYTLLVIWFIIAIIFFILTIVAIMSNEMSSYILYPALGFLIFITFYIIKNIYIYLNGL
jgi:hypothetical protein